MHYALTQELHNIVVERSLPVLAEQITSAMFTAHPHAEGHTREAQAGAGPRALAAAEGVCAAASCRGQKASGWPLVANGRGQSERSSRKAKMHG
jgi:hypothetical protein